MVIADGSSKEIITIQVYGEDGYPIKTDRDISLYFSSSSAMIGDVYVSATISKGDIYTSVSSPRRRGQVTSR